MREIPLTQGKVAIVDNEDFEYLSKFRWHAVQLGRRLWYANRNAPALDGYKCHRMQWDIVGKNADHKNGDGLDNRRENLRLCTKAQNNRNQRRVPTELSPYKGAKRKVYPHRIMWEAQIRVNARPVYLGLFGTPEEAALAYNWAAMSYFGEFALLNKVRYCLNEKNDS